MTGIAATVPKGTSGRVSAGAAYVTCRKGRRSMGRPRLRPALKSCQDCAAEPGQPHTYGCDTARCLQTGHQRLSCGFRHDHGHDIWSGEWPGVAECREFGWYSKFTGQGWVRCGPDDPDGGEDLNRLHELGGECHWDRKAARWVLNG